MLLLVVSEIIDVKSVNPTNRGNISALRCHVLVFMGRLIVLFPVS